MTTRLNLPDTFSWFVAHLDEPLELTIEGPSGLLFDAPCFIVGATDLYPGEVPTTLALEVEGVTPQSPAEQPMRLFLNARWMERVSGDEDELTVHLLGGETFRFLPYAPRV